MRLHLDVVAELPLSHPCRNTYNSNAARLSYPDTKETIGPSTIAGYFTPDSGIFLAPCLFRVRLRALRSALSSQVSAVSGIPKLDSRIEEAMNCRNCNSIINYNYITACLHCGCAVEGGDLPKLDPSTGSRKKQSARAWYVANLIYVLLTSGVGLISGAVVLYFGTAVIYLALSSPETYPGEHCGRGMALGMLSILAGAFLGTVGGTAFGLKHPIIE